MPAYDLQKTESPRKLLGFLQDVYYRDLPFQLWNHRLWFYHDILPLLNEAITGDRRRNIDMYLLGIAGAIHGVAFVCKKAHILEVKACLADGGIVDEIISSVAHGTECDVFIELGIRKNSEDAAKRVAGIGLYQGGKCYLWTNTPAEIPSNADKITCREFGMQDGVLFEEMMFSDGSAGWPEFPRQLKTGCDTLGPSTKVGWFPYVACVGHRYQQTRSLPLERFVSLIAERATH